MTAVSDHIFNSRVLGGLSLLAISCRGPQTTETSLSTGTSDVPADIGECSPRTVEVPMDGQAVTTNEALAAFDGVTSLVGGRFTIFGEEITSLQALRCLESADDLDLREVGVEDLTALSRLSTAGYLRLSKIDAEIALPSLEEVDNLVLVKLPQLKTMSGFPSLVTIGPMGLEVLDCDSLNSLGMVSLESLGALGLTGAHPSLLTLGELPFADHATLGLSNNAGLRNLKGAGSLTIAGLVNIHDSNLESLEGLENLTRIEGTGQQGFLAIEDMPKLETLAGLEQLTYVENAVFIRTSGVKSVEALSNLERIDGYLSLRGLNDLTTVGGLTNGHGGSLVSLGAGPDGGSLEVSLNDALPTCDALRLLESLEETGYGGPYVISGNLDDECEDASSP